jgi:hypothetical protein
MRLNAMAPDKLGTEMKYPTKPGGDEWYIGNNLKDDDRVKLKGNYKPPSSSGGLFHNGEASGGNPPSFRVVVSQKNGYDSDKTQELAEDRRRAAEVGHLQDSNDWTNYEMTGYFKVKRTREEDQITMYGRGGRHSDDNDPIKCQGSAYKVRLSFDGKPDLAKEYYHDGGSGYQYSGRDFPEGPVHNRIGSIMNRWVGMKAIVFNRSDGKVQIEIWADESMSDDGKTTQNRWEKIYEITDGGQMGRKRFPVEECGAPTQSQIFNWGGPQVTYRIDEIRDMDFQKLSVREIVPPTPGTS